jgi:23S rRNA pseudouridine2605 synthase
MNIKQRLSKVLAAAGIAARRKAEELIFSGRVKVNGEIVKVPQTLVDSKTDKILVDGEPISSPEQKAYFLLNKPKGMVCSALRSTGSRSVLELFDNEKKRLFTVGRLDKDTEGLLLVTNDGHFANKVIHPSSNIEKEYLAKTIQEVEHEHLVKISGGGLVEGVFVKPVRVQKVRKGTLKVVIKEGKKREVRVLLENAGLDVVSLARIRLGSLLLGNLGSGEYRTLTESDMRALFNDQE